MVKINKQIGEMTILPNSMMLSDLYHLENLMIGWKMITLESVGPWKGWRRKNPLQTSPAAFLHNPFSEKQTGFYRMDTGLCSKSNALCHTELLDMPKLECQVSHTDMAPVSRAVHHHYLWRVSWGLQWAHWMQKGMGYPSCGAVLFLSAGVTHTPEFGNFAIKPQHLHPRSQDMWKILQYGWDT